MTIVETRTTDDNIAIVTINRPERRNALSANTLGALDIALEAGEVVLSGSLAAMVPVKAGDNLRVTIGGIGGCSVRFT